MRTINHGYLFTFGLAFIVADIVLLSVNKLFMFLLIFQVLLIAMHILFIFNITEYDKEGILIKNPIRFYKKRITTNEIEYFLFRYKYGTRFSGIDLFVQLKTEGKLNYFQKLRHKKLLKYYVSKKDLLCFESFFKSNVYEVRYEGDFDLLRERVLPQKCDKLKK